MTTTNDKKKNNDVWIKPSSPPSLYERLVGTFVITTFILIWLSSLASPLLLSLALYFEWYIAASIMIATTLGAYLPWSKGPVSRFLTHLYSIYHPYYYQSLTTKYCGGYSPDDQPTFYSIHPHGAFCIGWAQLFCSLPKVRFCFAPALYISPFFRFFSKCVGIPGSASKGHMTSYMKKKESCALLPGGFEEASISCLNKDRVFLKKRTGFIRLCLTHGIRHVRPVYVFGEERLFWNIQGGWKLRLWLNRLGLPAILVWGTWLVPFVPKRNVDVTIVVGEPLVLPQLDHVPSKEEVKLWHDKYMAALTQLFETHKEEAYGAEYAKTAKLEIW